MKFKGRLSFKTTTLSCPKGWEDPHNKLQLVKRAQVLGATNSNASFYFSNPELITKIIKETPPVLSVNDKTNLGHLVRKNGMLFKEKAIYVPIDDLRWEVVRLAHNISSAVHFGISKTLENVSRTFWWPQMREFISKYIQSCECVRAKSSRHKPVTTYSLEL